MRDDWLMGRKRKGKVGFQKELKKLKIEKGNGVATQEIIVLVDRIYNLFLFAWLSLCETRNRNGKVYES